jgi:hypothetical protein
MPQPKGNSWVDHAKKMVTQRVEALEFIARVKEQVPQAQRRHAAAVNNLWLVSDELESQMEDLLRKMNERILNGAGQQDITRGAGLGPLGEGNNSFFYNCAWLLEWDSDLGIAIDLAIEPDSQEFFLYITSQLSGDRLSVEYPYSDVSGLQEALIQVFVSESTAKQFPDLRDTPDDEKYRTEPPEFMDEFQRMLAQHENQPPLS